MATEHVKVILVGDPDVGKSNIILRYTRNIFCRDFIQTIGIELLSKKLRIGETNVNMEIVDTAGQERFRALTSSHYRYADGVVIVFDTANRKSFERLPSWVDEVTTQASEFAQILIVGNKCDSAQRVVSEEEGIAFAKNLGYDYIDSSAKYDYNVTHIFETIVSETLEKRTFITRCPRAYQRKRKRTNSAKVLDIISQLPGMLSPRSVHS